MNMDTARVIEVVETTLTRRGDGKTSTDPIRTVTQYWSREGELLAERDPWDQTTNEIDRLANWLLATFPNEIGRGNPREGESAVDVAIRLLSEKK